MEPDKLLIAEYGYDDIREADMQKKIELERYCRQSKANSEFTLARADAMLAGACCFGSVIAAIVAPPAAIITMPLAVYFTNAAREQRDNAVLHATSAAMPDSATEAKIHQYEFDNPSTVIHYRLSEGRLVEEPALSPFRL